MKRIGLVGCGSIGELHASNFSGRAELLFCSRTRARAERFHERHGGIGVCDTYEELLNRDDVNAVVLATPAGLHKDQVMAALQAGKATLVEKPLCVSPAELDQVGAAVRDSGSPILMIAENYYYKPSLTLMKAAIEAGALGRIHSIEARKLTKQRRVTGWRESFGSLLEGGIHFVALVTDLADSALALRHADKEKESSAPVAVRTPSSTSAEFPSQAGDEPERRVRARLSYDETLSATLHYGWDVPAMLKGTFQHSRIIGDEGKITFESNGIYLWHGRRRRLTFPGFADLMGYRTMTSDFLSCLEAGRQPYSNFERASRDLGVVFDAYRAGYHNDGSR